MTIRLFFLIVAFQLYSKKLFSKDTLKVYPHHIVGIGLQHSLNVRSGEGYSIFEIIYRSPAPNLFYRFSLPWGKHSITAFTGDFFYRSGKGSSTYGSAGGVGFSEGNFEVVNFNIGVSQFVTYPLNKKISMSFGVGNCIGTLVYSAGRTQGGGYSLSSPSHANTANVDKELNRLYLAVNAEINFCFKLANLHSLCAGVKTLVESSDGFNTGKHYTFGGFVAYGLK